MIPLNQKLRININNAVRTLPAMATETLLAVLPAEVPTERVALVLVHAEAGPSLVVLRQESWCEKLGWCVQKTIEMTPQQVGALRAALGHVPARSQTVARLLTAPAEPSLPATIPFPARRLQAETA